MTPSALLLALGEIDGAPSDLSVALCEARARGIITGYLDAEAITAEQWLGFEAQIARHADERRNVLRGMRIEAGVRTA